MLQILPQMDIEVLEQAMRDQIQDYRSRGLKIFASSSFQTHSLPMLHLISRIDNTIPVFFINTGFHFPETQKFRDEITASFGLEFIDVKSPVPKSVQRDSEGRFYFTSDPDYCCFMNKTQPMKAAMMDYDVWINGIRKDQNANRSGMQKEESTPEGKLRYHPMLEWNSKMIYAYRKKHNLPEHPLEAKGYFSVGCEPCTRKFDTTNNRDGRWFGMKKTECGLHTDLVRK